MKCCSSTMWCNSISVVNKSPSVVVDSVQKGVRKALLMILDDGGQIIVQCSSGFNL